MCNEPFRTLTCVCKEPFRTQPARVMNHFGRPHRRALVLLSFSQSLVQLLVRLCTGSPVLVIFLKSPVQLLFSVPVLSPGGTAEGEPPQKQVKTDKPLPAYCNPPNPCPVGKTGNQLLFLWLQDLALLCNYSSFDCKIYLCCESIGYR